MKLKNLFLILFLFLIVFTNQTSNQKLKKLKCPKSGNTSINILTGETTVLAKNPYTIPQGMHVKTPILTDKLDEFPIPIVGNRKIETAVELPSEQNYYNGDYKLNKIDINCKVFVNQFDCIHQSFCGWCSGTGICMSGNMQGPYEPCLKGHFIFGNNLLRNGLVRMKTFKKNYGGVQTNRVISNNLRGFNLK